MRHVAPVVKLAYTPDSGSGAARCVGSNPTGCTNIWPLRLSARTSGSHPGKRSSTLLGAANKVCIIRVVRLRTVTK